MRILIYLILAIILVSFANAITIGITPGTITFSRIAKGGYAESPIRVTTSNPINLTGHVDVTGDIRSWIFTDLNNSAFEFSYSNPVNAKIIVRPPLDAPSGNYSALVSFVTDRVGSISEGSGSVIRASVAVILNIEIVGDQIITCQVGGYSIPNTEEDDPIYVSALFSNTGNTRIRPNVDITIWDQLKKNIVKQFSFRYAEILPTTRSLVSGSATHGLNPGQYWAEVSFPDCITSNLLTFNILRQGEIADSGDLLGIYVKPNYYVGDSVEIIPIFENSGSRPVSAYFIGSVYYDNKLIQELRSDEVLVEPRSQHNFRLTFNPKSGGIYSVIGKVSYNKKLTFERSTTFRALDVISGPSLNWILGVFYLILLLIILFLSVKVWKELRKK